MIDFVRGYYFHIFMLLTFRHKGEGLPQSGSSSFVFIFAIAFFTLLAKGLILGYSPIYPLMFFTLMTVFNRFMFFSNGWKVASAYAMILHGVILLELVALAVGVPNPLVFALYQLAAWMTALIRIIRNKSS